MSDINIWYDHGNYFELLADQRSKLWFIGRAGRLTSSRCIYADPNKSYTFGNRESLRDEMIAEYNNDGVNPFFSQNEDTTRGINDEEIAAHIYMLATQRYDVRLSPGLFVSKNDERFGTSIDIYADDCLGEIKNPKYVRKNLKELVENLKIKKISIMFGKYYDVYDFRFSNPSSAYIYPTYYGQITDQMSISGISTCDFISKIDNQLFIERINYNRHYDEWLQNIKKNFMDDIKLKPRIHIPSTKL